MEVHLKKALMMKQKMKCSYRWNYYTAGKMCVCEVWERENKCKRKRQRHRNDWSVNSTWNRSRFGFIKCKTLEDKSESLKMLRHWESHKKQENTTFPQFHWSVKKAKTKDLLSCWCRYPSCEFKESCLCPAPLRKTRLDFIKQIVFLHNVLKLLSDNLLYRQHWYWCLTIG